MATAFRQVVHARLYTALDTALAVNVFDHVPQLPEGMPDDSFPYVVVSDADTTPWDTDDKRGAFVDATLRVYSRYKGRKQVNEILDSMYAALHRATFFDAGYVYVDVLVTSSNVTELEDGQTRLGVLIVRVTIQEN